MQLSRGLRDAASLHNAEAKAHELRSKRMEAMVDRVLASRNRYLQYKYGRNADVALQDGWQQPTGAVSCARPGDQKALENSTHSMFDSMQTTWVLLGAKLAAESKAARDGN